MEVLIAADASLVDLSTIDEVDRAATWRLALPSLFPGLSVNRIDHRAPMGDVRRVPMGEGTFWAVHSPAIGVNYNPCHKAAADSPSLSVLMQVSGRTLVSQQHRMCELGAGDICILDEQLPFAMDGEGICEFVFLRMPRSTVLSRNPQLERQTAVVMPGIEPGVGLVGQTLTNVLRTAPFLTERQRRAALIAVIDMLGAIELPGDEGGGSAWWRVQAALSFIELNFAFHGLTAEEVAQSQRISRRRLDQLLRETLGLTITGQIWKRRLEQAASDLADPSRGSATASQIAFGNGFEDAAHFTRAFRRSYGCSPLQWRALAQRRSAVTQ